MASYIEGRYAFNLVDTRRPLRSRRRAAHARDRRHGDGQARSGTPRQAQRDEPVRVDVRGHGRQPDLLRHQQHRRNLRRPEQLAGRRRRILAQRDPGSVHLQHRPPARGRDPLPRRQAGVHLGRGHHGGLLHGPAGQPGRGRSDHAGLQLARQLGRRGVAQRRLRPRHGDLRHQPRQGGGGWASRHLAAGPVGPDLGRQPRFYGRRPPPPDGHPRRGARAGLELPDRQRGHHLFHFHLLQRDRPHPRRLQRPRPGHPNRNCQHRGRLPGSQRSEIQHRDPRRRLHDRQPVRGVLRRYGRGRRVVQLLERHAAVQHGLRLQAEFPGAVLEIPGEHFRAAVRPQPRVHRRQVPPLPDRFDREAARFDDVLEHAEPGEFPGARPGGCEAIVPLSLGHHEPGGGRPTLHLQRPGQPAGEALLLSVPAAVRHAVFPVLRAVQAEPGRGEDDRRGVHPGRPDGRRRAVHRRRLPAWPPGDRRRHRGGHDPGAAHRAGPGVDHPEGHARYARQPGRGRHHPAGRSEVGAALAARQGAGGAGGVRRQVPAAVRSGLAALLPDPRRQPGHDRVAEEPDGGCGDRRRSVLRDRLQPRLHAVRPGLPQVRRGGVPHLPRPHHRGSGASGAVRLQRDADRRLHRDLRVHHGHREWAVAQRHVPRRQGRVRARAGRAGRLPRHGPDHAGAAGVPGGSGRQPLRGPQTCG